MALHSIVGAHLFRDGSNSIIHCSRFGLGSSRVESIVVFGNGSTYPSQFGNGLLDGSCFAFMVDEAGAVRRG